jgi:probable HAF family extracellular repeat protein
MVFTMQRALLSGLAATTVVVMSLLATSSSTVAASRGYQAVDLGFDGQAWAINGRGQVVGEGLLTSDPLGSHGFLWSVGALTDLGVLEPGEWEYSRATDVNDRGQVVGFSVYRGDPEQSAAHAFLWQNGVLTDIDPSSLDSAAAAVNNRGQVVGTRYTAGGAHAFVWQAGVMTDLGTGYAVDINDRGQVIGQNEVGGTGATMWYHGRTYDLGAPPGVDDWRPIAINKRGWIAGNARLTTGRAYVWRSGVFLDLGTLGGSDAFVVDINDRGQVLGLSETASGGMHPFLWQGGTMIDLTTRGIPDYVTVNALGNHGEILGTVGEPFDQRAGYYR